MVAAMPSPFSYDSEVSHCIIVVEVIFVTKDTMYVVSIAICRVWYEPSFSSQRSPAPDCLESGVQAI